MKTCLLALTAALMFLTIHSLAADGEKPDTACDRTKTHDWRAWNNLIPTGDQAVHVTGRATVNSGGWKAALVKPRDAATNDSTLVLNLEHSPPRGPVI